MYCVSSTRSVDTKRFYKMSTIILELLLLLLDLKFKPAFNKLLSSQDSQSLQGCFDKFRRVFSVYMHFCICSNIYTHLYTHFTFTFTRTFTTNVMSTFILIFISNFIYTHRRTFIRTFRALQHGRTTLKYYPIKYGIVKTARTVWLYLCSLRSCRI